MTEALSLEGLERLIVQHIESVCSDGNTNPMSVAKPLAEAIRLQLSLPTGGDDTCEHCGTTGWGSDHAEDCPANPVPGFGIGKMSDLSPSPGGGLREALARALALFDYGDYVEWDKFFDGDPSAAKDFAEFQGGQTPAEYRRRADVLAALTQAPASQGGA